MPQTSISKTEYCVAIFYTTNDNANQPFLFYLIYISQMPPAKGLIWQFFLPGEKQNNSHNRAHCRGCIENSRPEGLADEVDDEGNVLLASESWVKDGMYSSHKYTIDSPC